MPKQLRAEQLAQYKRDGFVFPVAALSGERALYYRQRLEAYEAASGGRISSREPRTKFKMKTYLLCRWAYEIATSSAVLDAVEDLIGPNILLLHGVVFIKEPRTTLVAAWHQDSVYFGVTPNDFVTAWVALSDATPDSGFMKFAPGTNKLGDMPHMRGYAGSINSLAQAVEMEVDEDSAVQGSLRAGEFSMHHSRCLHYSGPNASDDRRIGISHIYVPTHVRCTGTLQRTAMLVRGVDEYHHFGMERPPVSDDDPQAQHEHERTCQRFRECHDEQVRWHEAGLDPFGKPRVAA